MPGVPVFVTWRLSGSLPRERVFLPEHFTSGQAFVAWDRLLDRTRTGPLYLGQPEIAGFVVRSLHEAARNGSAILHAYVVMPNHVHVLWTPQIALSDLLRQIKGTTAREANSFLHRRGEHFWQEEYFDRTVRNAEEFARIVRYIEWNPVKAGLVACPEEFLWSSAKAGLKTRAD
jgi:REP element-mobilizing transposase RayT